MIRRCVPLLLCGFTLAFAGCSALDDDHAPAGQTQVVVTNVLESQIQLKAEEVFYRHGFESRGGIAGRMEFERPGGTMDNILYGNWQSKDVSTHITLFITPRDPTTFVLRTRAMSVRNTFGADSDTKLFDVQGVKYRVILDKIAQELKAENPQ
jgi:hypothetical protein